MTDTANDLRWISSGWTIFNNKEDPVRQYEPFFSDTHHFEFEVQVGVSPILLYDPLQRVVATLHPDNTYEKVVFDPWKVENWDRNDIVTTSPLNDTDIDGFVDRLDEDELTPTWYEQRITEDPGLDAKEEAAEKAEIHADTPSVQHFDALGRPFLVKETNRYDEPDVLNGTGGIITEDIETKVVLDIEGHEKEVVDAQDRVIIENHWDMAGRQIYRASMDAGRRWLLPDINGTPVRRWDERGHKFRTEYDSLRRVTAQFVEGTVSNASDPRTLAGELCYEKAEYGEDETDPEDHNLRGKAVRMFDQAGRVETDRFDFKGNLLRSTRTLAVEYKDIVDWSGTPSLQTEDFVSETSYDALSRPVDTEKPDGSTIEIQYDEAGLFKGVDAYAVDDSGSGSTFSVIDVKYDSKGQRTLIEYGNGVETTYEYDPLTFQLTILKTTRSDGSVLQDLRYTYDPMGNVTSIRDHAQQPIFYNNRVVLPHKTYAYDSLYRLIETSGREHEGQSSQATPTSWDDEYRVGLAHPHDGGTMRTYERGFAYDEVGNLLKTRHEAGSTTWKREFEYESTSTLDANDFDNRLTKTIVGTNESTYGHDVHGNMTDMPHMTVTDWDFKDQLLATSTQSVSSGDPETTYYVYDASGNRVRKVTDRESTSGEPNRKNERIYLGGYEIYREYENASGESVETERKTLHVMDNQRRIAMIETKMIDNGQAVTDPQPLLRHQLGDHLESSSLELDDQGDIISYEEYYPYGSTSYQAVDGQTEVSAKRYRFTGKERDEESGLYYHGARYYAPWLARWTAPDPAGMVDGPNLYQYVRGNPVRLVDPDGRESGDVKKAQGQTADTQAHEELSDRWDLGVPFTEWSIDMHPQAQWERARTFGSGVLSGAEGATNLIGDIIYSGTPLRMFDFLSNPEEREEAVQTWSRIAAADSEDVALVGNVIMGIPQSVYDSVYDIAQSCVDENDCEGLGVFVGEEAVFIIVTGPLGSRFVSTFRWGRNVYGFSRVSGSGKNLVRKTTSSSGHTIHIKSGHGYRDHDTGHPGQTGLSRDQVESAIVDNLSLQLDLGLQPPLPGAGSAPLQRRLTIDGMTIEYNVLQHPTYGVPEISNYYPVQ